MAEGPAGDGMCSLSSRDLYHSRHAVRENTQTAERMVQGDVGGHQPEDGRECPRAAASAGFGYETAWLWLHKLRPAMVRPGRDRLKGSVEVDETYVGGPEEGSRGRQTEEKSIVAVAAEEVGDGIGRIRLGRIPDVSAPSRSTFIEQGIVEGSMIHTDDWLGYQGVEEKGYGHKVSHIKRSGDRPHELMPRVHRVSSLMKRWLLGTHQGSVSPKHLDYYLDEFTFRFNRRTSTHRGKLFFRLMEQAATIGPTTYLDIVGRRDPTWTRWG